MPRPSLHSSHWLRVLLWICGVLALVLGAIGIFVPGLPTTPFVLLAAACFVRASPRAHAWLLRNPTFGPLLSEWEEHRSMARRAKRIALVSMVLTVSVSVWLLHGQPWLRALLVAAALVGGITVLQIPSRG